MKGVDPVTPDKPLAQAEFIKKLRDDLEMGIGSRSVHAMIAQGMPVIRTKNGEIPQNRFEE